jgi:hypothetical protein
LLDRRPLSEAHFRLVVTLPMADWVDDFMREDSASGILTLDNLGHELDSLGQ